MKYRIHFQYSQGGESAFIIEGATIEEVQKKTQSEIDRRGVNEDTCWSECIEP